MKTIKKWPNKVLLTSALPVKEVTEEIKGILNEMAVVMLENNGVGLAAPQIGLNYRLITVMGEDTILSIANPEIEILGPETQESFEGCLSLPGANVKVVRPLAVSVTGLTVEGRLERHVVTGRDAAIICHEVDHLDGKTLLQTVDFMTKNKILKQMKNYERSQKKIKRHF